MISAYMLKTCKMLTFYWSIRQKANFAHGCFTDMSYRIKASANIFFNQRGSFMKKKKVEKAIRGILIGKIQPDSSKSTLVRECTLKLFRPVKIISFATRRQPVSTEKRRCSFVFNAFSKRFLMSPAISS